jgi:hypothetical protein
MTQEEQQKCLQLGHQLFEALCDVTKAQTNLQNRLTEADEETKQHLFKRLHDCELNSMAAIHEWKKFTKA